MVDIAIDKIALSGWNPRKNFEPEAFEELKKSIRQYGILEPLIVRQTVESNNPLDGEFELVAGERRFRAAKELGLKNVPVVIRTLSDRDVREIMLIENLQRSGLEPLEEASALEVLLQDGSTQEELGKKLGKSQAWVANRLRLLKAPDELKELLISQQITPKHLLTLLPVSRFPAFSEVLVDLKEKIEDNGSVSVQDLNDIIDGAVRFDKTLLNLDSFPYEKKQCKDFFDFSKCNECKDIVVVHEWSDKTDERHCMTQGCWTVKMSAAQAAYDLAKAKEVKALEKKDTVDSHTLGYGNYKTLGYGCDFDKTECSGCEKCKKDKHNNGQLICIDPACFTKKQGAWQKEKNRKARDEAEKVWEALEEKLSGVKALGEKEIRFLASALGGDGNVSRIIWAEAVKKAMAPWEKKKGEVPDVKDIPSEDLPRLLLRFVICQRMSGGAGLPGMKDFEKAIEGLEV